MKWCWWCCTVFGGREPPKQEKPTKSGKKHNVKNVLDIFGHIFGHIVAITRALRHRPLGPLGPLELEEVASQIVSLMILIQIREETTSHKRSKNPLLHINSNKTQVAAQQSDSGKVPMEVVLDLGPSNHFGAAWKFRQRRAPPSLVWQDIQQPHPGSTEWIFWNRNWGEKCGRMDL